LIVIPAVDIRRGRVVRLRQGRSEDETAYTDDPVGAATAFAEAGATRLHVVDLDAAFGSGENRDAIRGVLASAGAGVQVGGGIRGLDEAGDLLDAGAERIIIGTEAVKNPAFLEAAVERFGDAVIVAMDVKGDRVRVRGWTDQAGTLEETLPRVLQGGAPRLLVTQVSRDGTLEGPDRALYEGLVSRVDVPVVASGGVRDVNDLRELASTGVEAVIVGRALYEGRMTLEEALEATT
jgi:phosphoribosylformimino-5-aminoimidazole carboxamide ribotide isomerase